MGCGCGGGLPARRPTKSVIKSPSQGVLRAVHQPNRNVTPKAGPPAQNITDEKRRVEKLRRDAILRALGRP